MKTRRIICIITTLLTVLSCGNVQKKGANNNLFEMIQVLSDVTADSLSTWQDVMNATTPVLDSIILDATDDVNLKKRMLGQELGYLVMEALTDKYLDLENIERVLQVKNWIELFQLFKRLYLAGFTQKMRDSHIFGEIIIMSQTKCRRAF